MSDSNQKVVRVDGEFSPLFVDIRQLVLDARQRTAVAVNAELTLLYWDIGNHIQQDVLGNQRAGYGKAVVRALAGRMTEEFGRGWSEKQLRHCLHAAEVFPERKIVYALSRQLSWTHIRKLMYLDNPLKREFYMEMAQLEGWSTRQLNERIQSMLYERTAISKKPEETIAGELAALREEGVLSAELAFRDPYVLDFLGLSDTYSEQDLESAILAELERFIIELGTDFAFVARQRRMVIDDRDYYMDLVFFHRRLRRLVVIDLKLGEFEAGFKGQMELYLRYLERHDMLEGENPPVGLILCTGKNEEHVELLRLDDSNIRVAEYLTELPSREVLQRKLHDSVLRARERLVSREESKR